MGSTSFWFRLINPFWYPRHIHQIDLDDKITIRFNTSIPLNAPVFVYIHHGDWSSGSNKLLPVFTHYLVLNKWILVSLNHVKSPSVRFPSHLIDVKKSLQWVRENIKKFGGDPTSIYIGGSGSGAHIATLCGLTRNDPFYQPGFELVDTSVSAVVSVSGCYDFKFLNKDYQFWFDSNVSDSNTIDIKTQSPLHLIKEFMHSKRNNAGCLIETAIESSKVPRKTDYIPPFFIAHGGNDSKFPIKIASEFADTLNTIEKGLVTSVVFSLSGNYFFYRGIRAHYLAYGIVRFLESIRRSGGGIDLDEAKKNI